ncbi:KEOPS complex subunit Pcc1 [Halovenus aranensis]|uniref:KEOPS complex subunit Pcc1 n=1 Tax=Halovenus aranensis TaxID=890420 RepID=A0A1G8SPN8_9EURY|nr:KEOPS complex subunit Pcc1 [Halovenus aranensis]SDJ31228.1 KEOPS complex subunit Pcc1 [Halovenus aranensis]
MTSDRFHDTVLTVDYASPTAARRVARAIEPEIGDIDDDRSSVSLRRESNTVELHVTASDVVALRASLNTWLSLVQTAEAAGKLA